MSDSHLISSRSFIRSPTAWLQIVIVHARAPAQLSSQRARMCAVLCRDEAQKVWRLRHKLAELGVHVVGLVHEEVGEEVCAVPRARA